MLLRFLEPGSTNGSSLHQRLSTPDDAHSECVMDCTRAQFCKKLSSDNVKDKVRIIQRSATISKEEKEEKISEIFAEVRASWGNCLRASFGRDFKECVHYQRHCLIKANCCGKYYGCRLCHDEVESHKIDRFATELVHCKSCGTDDVPIGKNCGTCGKSFAKYYCSVCKFHDDDLEKDVYHCDPCGICRVGKKEENSHCSRCDSCVPKEVAQSHPCVPESTKGTCPVCLENMWECLSQVVFMRCGHAIHEECFAQYTETSYTCPVCCKSLTDMSSWNRAVEAMLGREEMPPNKKSKKMLVYCNDCERECATKFHWTYLKCSFCSGYNTRVLGDLPDTGCTSNSLNQPCPDDDDIRMKANGARI